MPRKAVSAALSALLLLSACSRIGERPQSGASHGSGNSWTIHGVVRLAEAEEPNSLVRLFSHQASADDVTALLFEPFLRFDERENPVPGLALQLPTAKNGLISKDGLRITFNLRRGVLWSDGVPFDARDVVFTWHAIVDGNNPVTFTSGFDAIKNIVVEDPHRLTLVLKEPLSSAVYLFSEGSFPPLPAHILSKFKTLHNIPYDAAPIGDGPFVLKQWLHGSELVFAANPKYWRGSPRAREVVIKIIPTSDTQVAEIRTHEIDLLDGISKPLVSQVRGLEGVRLIKQLSANYRHLDFNFRNPILADTAVRRAIVRGIDVNKIIKDVYAGLGVRAVSDVPPFSWAANDLQAPAYDPAQARRILDADGWKPGPDRIRRKNGQRLALTISSTTDNRPNAAAEQLAAQELQEIGVDLGVKNYAGAVLFAPDGPLYGGKYDLSWTVATEGVDPDDLALWGCDYWPPHGVNTEFYCNHRVDGYLRDAQRVYDRDRRRQDYREAWKIMLDEVPALMIYWDDNVSAINSDFKNFKPSPVVTDYWNAWEWEI